MVWAPGLAGGGGVEASGANPAGAFVGPAGVIALVADAVGFFFGNEPVAACGFFRRPLKAHDGRRAALARQDQEGVQGAQGICCGAVVEVGGWQAGLAAEKERPGRVEESFGQGAQVGPVRVIRGEPEGDVHQGIGSVLPVGDVRCVVGLWRAGALEDVAACGPGFVVGAELRRLVVGERQAGVAVMVDARGEVQASCRQPRLSVSWRSMPRALASRPVMAERPGKSRTGPLVVDLLGAVGSYRSFEAQDDVWHGLFSGCERFQVARKLAACDVRLSIFRRLAGEICGLKPSAVVR